MQPQQHNLGAVHDESLGSFPEELRRVANKLVVIHGPGRLARESGGVHLYLPCPCCLEREGTVEIGKQHLTVNLTKLVLRHEDTSAICHKTDKVFSFEELIRTPKLEDRGIVVSQKRLTTRQADPRYLTPDYLGRSVPCHPGDTTPIDKLPCDHVAIQYLVSRGQGDPESIQNLRTCVEMEWCNQYHDQFPYRRAAPGFPNTPSWRLIMYNRQFKSCFGWQARVIEFPDGQGGKLFLNKNQNGYFHHPYGADKIDLQKYINAFGMSRQRVVFGYDAAVQFNINRVPGKRYCIVVEGPGDTSVVGPPTVALTGKYASPVQLIVLCSAFDHFLLATDNDNSGKKLKDNLTNSLLKENKKCDYIIPSPGKKDIGDSDRSFVRAQIQRILHQRGL